MDQLFRTIFPVTALKEKLTYDDTSLFIGSCFSENIGNIVLEKKFDTDINPFGIVYNPASIVNTLENILNKKSFSREDLFFHEGCWHSFAHHSRFSMSSVEETLQQINERSFHAYHFLQRAKFLFITLGTAWVYELASNGAIVSNCHKLPAAEFQRRIMDASEICMLFSRVIPKIIQLNPQINIVFTVSPIRHFKDGATSNQLSKSTLIVAVHELIKQFQFIEYFPAYEIMMDDLRDYRFYEKDMLHPNELAIEYLWDKFRTAIIDSSAIDTMKEVEQITNASRHRPFNMTSKSHQQFIHKNLEKISALKIKYPKLDFTAETDIFKLQCK
jgi:hypothetical protein